MRSRRTGSGRLVAYILVGTVLVACGSESSGSADLDAGPVAEATDPGPEATSQSPAVPSGSTSAESAPGPVPSDLRRLADEFVDFAVGNANTFPHWESVILSIGGQTVVAVDDFAAALRNRDIWSICPADWKSYGASSCPVDLLDPIQQSAANDWSLSYSTEPADVTCAPPRSGPAPDGRVVVIRPRPQWRTCTTDFALALSADKAGLLRAVDLTLASP